MKIYFVTGNANKFAEAKAILHGLDLEQLDIDLPELQGEPEEIALEKAVIACEKAGKPVFVDDTSLCCNAMGGLPGPYIKHFLEKIGTDGVYKMASAFGDTSAYAQACIGYCEPGGKPLVFKGMVHGRIVSPRGESGFKFDRIFMPDGHDRAFAEMSKQEKNEISHRRLALENFRQYLLQR